MRIVQPSFQLEDPFEREDAILMLKKIERAARMCYKSEGLTTDESFSPFVTKIATVFKHVSVIEHSSVSVRFVCDRGVTHEMVRHRIAAYSQESTRYCNYCKDKFDGHIQLIHPVGLSEAQYKRREDHFWAVQELYDAEISEGVAPQLARGILPTCLKTEIVMTCNLREWQHVFKLRTSDKAHPQIREVMQPLFEHFNKVMPELFY